MPDFHGFDHVDARVRSLPGVEPFYDRLMPALGLPRKTYAHVDTAGDWDEPDAERPYNTVEYHEEPDPSRPGRFIGFIEDRAMAPARTRIAFALGSRAELEAWEPRLREFGACGVERSADMDAYPAIFFEDPGGTKLELCARNPRRA